MTFDEWLDLDEGVMRFELQLRIGLQLRKEWIDAARAGWEAGSRLEREACRDACHEAIKRACAEAGVKEPTFVGMCLEVGLERFDDVLTANTGDNRPAVAGPVD